MENFIMAMRKTMSKTALAKKNAKAKATRDAKKDAALKELGIDVKRTKFRKKRKPMTEEQRAQAVARLEKARKAKGPAKHTQFHPDVVALPDEHELSLKNVRQWLKTQKELLISMKAYKDSKNAVERNRYNTCYTYVSNLNTYLTKGVYVDHKIGEHGTGNIKYTCTHMSFKADGTPKRSHGVYYPDMGMVYQTGMEDKE